MNSPQGIRKRLLKYLLPVIIISIAFNIPKFMEAEICWRNMLNNNETSKLVLEYSTINNWTASVNDDLSARHNLPNSTIFPVCHVGDDVDILLTYDEIWKPRVS